MHYRWSKMKWQYNVIKGNLGWSLKLVIPELMLCSNTIKNPGTAHKQLLVKGSPVYHLTVTYLYVSIWIKFSATFSASFSHIQYVRMEVDLVSSIMFWRWKAYVLALHTGMFCGFRGDYYKGYKFTKCRKSMLPPSTIEVTAVGSSETCVNFY